MSNLNYQYEVLSPWAETDPIPLRGISPRVTDLTGKTVGLFATRKPAAMPILTVLKQKLSERYPTLKFSWFTTGTNIKVTKTEDRPKFEKWVREVDTAVGAPGD